jgi:hypothetical protein
MAASQLARAHIEVERRLRLATVTALERIWRNLPGYDRANVDQWLSQVLPFVAAAQRQSVAVTEAYLARAMGRPPLGLNPDNLIGAAVRNGTSPEEVYKRPFVSMWSSLGSGNQWQDAFGAGLARATGSAAMDPQLSMRATADAVNSADPNMYGFTRVADDGACDFCEAIDGAYVKFGDAMELHPNCGCSLEPNTEPHRLAAKLPSGVAVHQHGELGPVLAAPGEHFTGPSGLA